jgi:hypothetical protein
VLHLVQDTTATLTEAARVLAPGGRIAASVNPDREPAPDDIERVMIAMAVRLGRDAEDAARQYNDRVLAAAEQAGLRQVEATAYPAGYHQTSPASTIRRIQDRSWSWMWDQPDETFGPAAEEAVAALRALPDQDRPRANTRVIPVLAFTHA